jgi:penicillin amidase
MPAVMFGRNERVAWGCTNNICSQRDLYQEKTDPAHPNCFLFDGRWEPARTLEEVIAVKGREPERRAIRFSRNGPIVNDVLPPPARAGEPVAIRWLGAYEGGWLTALLGMDRARSAEGFREATRPWHVPTFSLVFADVDGSIGYQSVGRIPLRKVWERGYRPGWEPEHQWDGLIPFGGMPQLADPERGWVATANNRPAPDDFAYPLAGTWSEGGLRAGRIRQLIEARPKINFADCAAMHHDSLSLRALRCLPHLLPLLAANSDGRIQEAVTHLREWDGLMEPDRVGATIFDVFFAHWTRIVIRERFDGDTAALLTGGAGGLAATLLATDKAGWFASGRREPAIQHALATALDWLAGQLGSDMTQWTWGRLHVLPLRHALSGRGDLGRLLDHGGTAVPGDGITVCNTASGSRYEARSGAGYRLIADLGAAPPALWAVDGQSQSGHPGSPHYADQLPEWLERRYHVLPLDPTEASRTAKNKMTLEPKSR